MSEPLSAEEAVARFGFYTGLTRAKRRAIVVGDWPAVIRAIETVDTERRNTLLAARITQTG